MYINYCKEILDKESAYLLYLSFQKEKKFERFMEVRNRIEKEENAKDIICEFKDVYKSLRQAGETKGTIKIDDDKVLVIKDGSDSEEEEDDDVVILGAYEWPTRAKRVTSKNKKRQVSTVDIK